MTVFVQIIYYYRHFCRERQEHLKSLWVQFSLIEICFVRCNWNLSEGASVEVLDDVLAPSTGYIVNDVREKGEETVRISPSIRFMIF